MFSRYFYIKIINVFYLRFRFFRKMADRQNSRHRNETNRDLPPPNPMPPPAAVAAPANDADDRILAGALETARDIRQFRSTDRTYVYSLLQQGK